MTIQESQKLKGLAILMMLFFHLFNRMENCEQCINFIYINKVPLVNFLSRSTYPVYFYIFLSGIGLYYSYLNGRCNFKINLKRCLRLFIHYWFILLLFILAGFFVVPRYPSSISIIDFVKNFFAFDNTYNRECWFMMPYLFLLFLSPILFRLVDRFNYWYVMLGTIFINLITSAIISHFGDAALAKMWWVYKPLLYFHLLNVFMLGVAFVKTDFSVVRKLKKLPIVVSFLLLAVLVAVRGFLNFYFVENIYVICICIVVISITIPSIDKILRFFGKHSMNMWMIHSWFCYYLFHDTIYSIKYPLLIYLLLIVISLITSMLVNFVLKKITSRVV